MLFRICKKHNLHLQTEPTYGSRNYLEKQDFIIENQKEKISVQKDILSDNEQAIEEQEKKIHKAENILSQREKVIKKQDVLIAEKNAAIIKEHSVLEDVTMKLADMETLVEKDISLKLPLIGCSTARQCICFNLVSILFISEIYWETLIFQQPGSTPGQMKK